MKIYELIEKLQKLIDDNNMLKYGENEIIDGDIYYEGRILDLKCMDKEELEEEIRELENALK